MEAFFIYILKACGIILLFHTAYELLLKKETFFITNRIFLLTGLLLSFFLPLVVIQNIVEVEVLENTVFQSSINSDNGNPMQSGISTGEIVQLIFLIGLGFMLGRFIIQLLSVRNLIRSHKVTRIRGFKIVEMNEEVAPFSFFNHIFYNPSQYRAEELKAILEHEKVHCRQWHSLDVLLAQLVLILLWINPVSWFYLRNVQQNLEFLADSQATKKVNSRKVYEYTMLKISGKLKVIPVTNNFYNSLIKKRIVMLHQSKSNKLNFLKILIVLPFLALFLWSFNTETVYVPADEGNIQSGSVQNVDIRINKDTSDEELEELKKDLSKEGIDFSYTVVHNDKMEIIDLSVSFSSSNKGNNTFEGSSNFNNGGDPIDPVTIVFDNDNNIFYMGEDGEITQTVHADKHYSTWVHSDDDSHQSIEIYQDNGKEVIKVNGKKVSRKELEKMEKKGKLHKKHIKLSKDAKVEAEQKVIIMSDHQSEHDVEVISADNGGFFFYNGDLDDNWLILLNGKEVDQDAIQDLNPDDVETINVLKGEKASKKYGSKAKDGVLEVTTNE